MAPYDLEDNHQLDKNGDFVLAFHDAERVDVAIEDAYTQCLPAELGVLAGSP
jgi:hypothetical protein